MFPNGLSYLHSTQMKRLVTPSPYVLKFVLLALFIFLKADNTDFQIVTNDHYVL